MPAPRKPKPDESTDRASAPEVYVATQSFACEIDGEQIIVNAGRTRVVADHPLYAAYPHYFKRADEGTLGVDLTR